VFAIIDQLFRTQAIGLYAKGILPCPAVFVSEALGLWSANAKAGYFPRRQGEMLWIFTLLNYQIVMVSGASKVII
jgi:hypothetical protein